MIYYIWIISNVLFMILTSLIIWNFVELPSTNVIIALGFAQIAILLFIINVNMYFIFLVIRKIKFRKVKIILSKLSRKMMKAHIPIALIATSFIVLHASIMFMQLSSVIGFISIKFLSGYFSIFLLLFTLFSGYRRHKKASGFRRKFHLTMAILFTLSFVFHILI